MSPIPTLDLVQLRTALPLQLVTLRRTGYAGSRSFPTTHATPKVLRVTRDAGETAARKGGEAR